MASSFLGGFSVALVKQLLDSGKLEVEPGREQAVVDWLHSALTDNGKRRGLVSTAAAALISCPDVVELYADNDGLKEAIDDIGRLVVFRTPDQRG